MPPLPLFRARSRNPAGRGADFAGRDTNPANLPRPRFAARGMTHGANRVELP